MSARRGTWFQRIPAGLVTTVVSLALWQLVTMFGPVSETSIPTAGETLASFGAMLTESDTYSAIWDTLSMAIGGFFLAVVVAIPMGTLIGLSRFSFLSTKFVFDFFKVIPPIVIIPITILVFGPTKGMGVFLVFFTIVFALSVQTAYGIRDTDPVLLETMRCYRLGLLAQLRYARIPSAAPFIAVGIRVAVAAALVVSVVSGLIGGAPGLGKSILLAQSAGLNDRTFALILLLGLIGTLVSFGVVRSQGRLLFWTQT
jgi:ABC-type nitrate/sulfonate/bicarbonate transport system permease component